MQPVMTLSSQRVAADTHALQTFAPFPGYGVVPINAHLIRAREPVLVDTGLGALQTRFLGELRRLIDPADLRWIWLTHADADHVGNLRALLAEAPQARVVTNFLGMGKLGQQQLPLDRVHLLNPGQALDVGDRRLVALRPPSYDAPETMGLFDTHTRALFSSDCFGALLAEPAERAEQLAPAALREGIALWSSIDVPWLSRVSAAHLAESLKALQDLAPAAVLSSHLPAAAGMAATLFESLLAAREAAAFVGPDQAALERLMRMPQAA
jgi:glyoxylase-like metal-dependent hydrolase (beta-lactamase superfamily II)